MNAGEFVQKYGNKEAEKLCIEAGVSYLYFRNLVNRVARPGVKTALKLEKASNGVITLDDLIRTQLKRDEAPPKILAKNESTSSVKD